MVPPKQYYLSATPPQSIPDGYQREQVGNWHLVFDENYNSIHVVRDTESVGNIIGNVFDVNNTLSENTLKLNDDSPESFEDQLAELAGRFVAVINVDGLYAYTDPAGALPLVYEPNECVLGTTPTIIPNVNSQHRFRRRLFDRISYEADNIWLPGTLTYYEGVKRLLPNHRLNLQTWETTRYWPRTSETFTMDDLSDIVESVATTLQDFFEIIVSTYDSPLMSLTAGKDSRVLAAAARSWLLEGDVRTFTWDFEERYDVDVDIARRLSLDYHLDWKPVPVVSATEAEKQWWLEQTGHAVGGTILDIHPTIATLDTDVQINGFGGEIARGYYWADGDDPDKTFDETELLDRLHLPIEPALQDSVAEWYAGVSEFDAFSQLDLMYQELRLGCWAGPHHLAMTQFHDFVGPLYYRKIVEKMYRLPPEIRREDTFPELVVDRLWPELNEYPYTAYDDWRDNIRTIKEMYRKMQVVRTRPVRASSYLLRQLLRN